MKHTFNLSKGVKTHYNTTWSALVSHSIFFIGLLITFHVISAQAEELHELHEQQEQPLFHIEPKREGRYVMKNVDATSTIEYYPAENVCDKCIVITKHGDSFLSTTTFNILLFEF